MLEIGITGGIGSGKTIICRILEVLGYPVFYADTEAKQVMISDPELVTAIKQYFGEAAYTVDGLLDRKYLAKIVFNDQQKLNKLNELVHPATIKAYQRWATEQQSDLIFKEAALLFESGSYKLADYSVLVSSPDDLRIKRVVARDQITEQEVRNRMNKQWEDDRRRKLADFIIINDEENALLPQVLQLRDELIKRSQGKVKK